MVDPLSIGMCAQAACILDVATYKPGNVSLISPFPDMTAKDMLLSAAAIAPVLEQARFRRVGLTILDCIQATRRVTNVNTNLGIVLLLAPLASVTPDPDLRDGLERVLTGLDVADARSTYEAIRLANPGGLGKVAEQDVWSVPTISLREVMGLAADRDLVARQYVNNFKQVFENVESIREDLKQPQASLGRIVTRSFLRILSKNPDSLVIRKFGRETAEELSQRAGRIVSLSAMEFDKAVLNLDAAMWGRFNPGTTADLVVASLFVGLRQNIIQLPLPKPG
jgi:triphosphoribosyl-dephospho-CoA synthase